MKTLFTGLGVAVIVAGVFFALHLPNKMKYDERMEKVVATTQLVAHSMNEEARTYLETVRGSWTVQNTEEPDGAFLKISSVTGFQNTVDGIVEFYTREAPPYSFFDIEQNTKENKIAAAQAIALPNSMDGRVYHREGICFIKLSENLVEVFEDSENGLSRTLYTKVEISEQD